jgi:hypothetical protein
MPPHRLPARRQARIADGKDPEDRSDYHGRPTRPKKLEPIESPGRYVPAGPLSLADAAAQLCVRPVLLAQVIREGTVAMVRGRGGELLVARVEVERVRRDHAGDAALSPSSFGTGDRLRDRRRPRVARGAGLRRPRGVLPH